MRLNHSHRRSAGCPGLFIYWGNHDSVFDFSHQLIHSWSRERSSAIRNLRPAQLPQLGDFGTISQVPQPSINMLLEQQKKKKM